MSNYVVERTQPTMYLDKGGKPVRGFVVYVNLIQWDELHEVNVPSLKPEVVESAIQELIEYRTALQELGQ